MARTKSAETITAEAQAQAELNKRLANFVKSNVRTGVLDELKKIGAHIMQVQVEAFLLNESAVDADAAKLAIEYMNELYVNLRKEFDENVKTFGVKSKVLRSITPIYGSGEKKGEKVLTPEEIVKQKLAAFQVK